MAEKGSQLEIQVLKALENIRSGDNGIVTEEEIQRAAEMAYSLIELPDFAAMIPEAITADISAVRDGLEILVGENRLQLEITDVKGLEESLQQLAQARTGTGGGTIGKNQVYNFIREAIADGTISVSGASSFLALSDTPASYTGEELKVVRVNAAGDALEFNAPSSGGNAQTADPLSQFAATTLTQLNGVISDATLGDASDFATAAQGALADSAQQPPSEGAFVNGDKTKLNTYSEANQTANNAKISFDSTASTKVGHITVTQAVNLDTMESNIATNNAKVTNATHTGEVTGATALTIAANAVTNAKAAQMATKTYKGRTAAGTGNSEDVPIATLKTDLALNLVTNTSDANKPVSTAQQTALNLKANLASPTFTGTPTLPTGTIATTQSAGNSTTAIATTAFATTALALKANIRGAVNAQTGTTYTLVIGDEYLDGVRMTNAAANTITIPPNSAVAFPVNTKILITQGGAGSTTVAAGAGVTLNAPASAPLAIGEIHGSRVCQKTATDTWLII